MIDFEKELDKLLSSECGPLEADEFTIITDEGNRVLTALNKKQADISLQVEEIYDIVRENGTSRDALLAERSKVASLLDAVVGLTDLLDNFLRYAAGSGHPELENQARIMKKNAGMLHEKCAIVSFGEAGESLHPELHTVYSVEASDYPREHIVNVLESGYRYMGAVIRKATVTVSSGAEDMSQVNKDNPCRGDQWSPAAGAEDTSQVNKDNPCRGDQWSPAAGAAVNNKGPKTGRDKPAEKAKERHPVKTRSSGGFFKLFSRKSGRKH